MPATLRCVIFPAGLDATADRYARVFAGLAELFGVARSTVCCAGERAMGAQAT